MITDHDEPSAECQCGREVGVTPITFRPALVCAACQEPLCDRCLTFNAFGTGVHATCEAPMLEPESDPMCQATGDERIACAWRHSCRREYACND